MSEFLKPFEMTGGVTLQQVVTFIVLIVPGFVALRVYDMQRGGEGRNAKDVLIDVLVYSVASNAVVFGAVALSWALVAHPWRVPVTIVLAIVLFIVTPIVLATAFTSFSA